MPAPISDALSVVKPHAVPPPVTVGVLGSGLTVIFTVLVAAGQGTGPAFVVNVRVTTPDTIEGVYVEVNELALEKVPLGADHVEVEALPPILPERAIVAPAHTDCGNPAFAVGAVLITTAALP